MVGPAGGSRVRSGSVYIDGDGKGMPEHTKRRLLFPVAVLSAGASCEIELSTER